MDTSDEEYDGSNSPPDMEVDTPLSEGVARRTRATARSGGDMGDGGGGSIQELKLASGNGYLWEDVYQRLWDVVEDGGNDGRSLDLVIQQMVEARKKKIMRNSSTPFQRGIIRTVIVVVDGLLTMLEKDLRPLRFLMTLALLSEFVVEFFDQNPISQLGIVMMRNGIAHLVSEVSGLPQLHLERVRQVRARQHNRYEPKGDPSLQNALEMARLLLKVSLASNRNSKEILVILGALFTLDPGDIHRTIDRLVEEDIRVRVIGLLAQVAICQELVNRTNLHTKQTAAGKKIIPASTTDNNYGIIVNEAHFRDLLMDCVVPLPVPEDEAAAAESGVPLIKVGFPQKLKPTPATMGLPQLYADLREDEVAEIVTLDLGAADSSVDAAAGGTAGSADSAPSSGGGGSGAGVGASGLWPQVAYECPRCGNRVRHLPTVCSVCELMLILSTHLSRSYHHLVPLNDYSEVPVAESYPSRYCYGCLLEFPEGTTSESASTLDKYTSSRYRCPRCRNDFCIECDVFVHESLHNCPGCENSK